MTLGDFNNDGLMDVAVGTADRWVYILYGKADILIPQQAEIQGKLVIGLPTGISPPNLSNIDPVKNTVIVKTFLLLLGLLILVSSLFLRRYR